MSQESPEFSVLYFSDRRQLAQFLGQLDACLANDLGPQYAVNAPELELWACTQVVVADSLAASGPCLYANNAVMRCVGTAGLAWTYAGRVTRENLPENAWPVIGPLAYTAPVVERAFSDFTPATRSGAEPEGTAREAS